MYGREVCGHMVIEGEVTETEGYPVGPVGVVGEEEKTEEGDNVVGESADMSRTGNWRACEEEDPRKACQSCGCVVRSRAVTTM